MAERSAAPPRTFTARVAWIFFGALSLLALTSFLSYQLERQLILRVNRLLSTSMAWAQLAEDTELMEAALEKYVVSGDEASLNQYLSISQQAYQHTCDLASNPALYRDVLAAEDAQGMVQTMQEQAGGLTQSQGHPPADAGALVQAFSATGEHLRTRIHLAVMDLLRRESGDYRLISARLGTVGRVALLLMLSGLILAFLVPALSLYRLTRPLGELAEAAERVSRGDFSRPVPVRNHDEVGYVAEAFNQMAAGLRRLIQDLREKSALEVRLRERELENMAMQNTLQKARLQALQSQMNPHFFFNTLNASVHLANLENAERTASFLENVGRLFRYSLRKPEATVALEEELNHVENYVSLLHMRFGDGSFSYSTEIESTLLDTPIPRLTLQPLVENAYLHGLADSEGGRIVIRGSRQGESAVIEVADDGVGISTHAVEQALHSNEKAVRPGGLGNVIARLRLWTGREAVEIEGSAGHGTVVRLRLPA